LAKPMLVTLPFTLLLFDYWPLHRVDPRHDGLARWGRLLLEKTPLVALALGFSGVAVFAQRHGGSMTSLGALPIASRLAHAAVAYLSYLGRLLWPARLAVFY